MQSEYRGTLHACDLGTTSFRYSAPFKWNGLQTALKLHSFIPFGDFKALLSDVDVVVARSDLCFQVLFMWLHDYECFLFSNLS